MSKPVVRALMLSAATVVGLVGMLVTDGVGDWAMLAVALAPLMIAVGATMRSRS